MAVGLATIGIKMYKEAGTGSSKTLIPNLQSTPELGGTPEKIDVTTLADTARHYIPGVKDYGDLECNFLYDADQTSSAWNILKGLEGKDTEYSIEMPDGSSFKFTADVSCRLAAAEVNAAITFIASFAIKSDVVYTAGTKS